MTRVFDEHGKSVPVTALEVTPNVVTQVRSADVDGYWAVQVGWGDIKARNSTMPMIGHDFKAGTDPKRYHGEFRVNEEAVSEYEPGQEIGLDVFDGVLFVDVIGTSKGKGFQGAMKRWNFAGLEASHGVERKHRAPGSQAGHATNLGTGPKPKKGKKRPGQMGNDRVTVRCLDIVRVDKEQNVLLVKGPVPGWKDGVVRVRPSTRLGRSKTLRMAQAAG